jgi:Protein of unknown function (DUF2809)
MRRSLNTLTILLITIPIGLAVRFLPLHLPWFLYKYFGSTLWAAALYWFLATLLPKLRPQTLAPLTIIVATLVELSRLIPIASIDASVSPSPEKSSSAAMASLRPRKADGPLGGTRRPYFAFTSVIPMAAHRKQAQSN